MFFSGDVHFFFKQFFLLQFLYIYIVKGSNYHLIILLIILFGFILNILVVCIFYRFLIIFYIACFTKVSPIYGIYFDFFIFIILTFYSFSIKSFLFYYYHVSFLRFPCLYLACLILIFYLVLLYYAIRNFIKLFYPLFFFKNRRLFFVLDEFFFLFFLFFLVSLCFTNTGFLFIYLDFLFAYFFIYIVCFLSSNRFFYSCAYIKKNVLPFHDFYFYFLFYIFYLIFVVFLSLLYFLIPFSLFLYTLVFTYIFTFECNKELNIFLKYMRRDLDSFLTGYKTYRILFVYYMLVICLLYIFVNYGTIFTSLGIEQYAPIPYENEQDFIDFLVKFIPDYQKLLKNSNFATDLYEV